MNIPRIMIAAAKRGGKTLLSCALMMLFHAEGKASVPSVRADYIDPMFHRTVLGVPSRNLDTFSLGRE